MKFINHNDFKNELFKSVKFKEEYEKLDSIYEIKNKGLDIILKIIYIKNTNR
jgi:hypothetical protein